MEFEGDGREAVVSLRRYRVNFADAATVLHDDEAITFRGVLREELPR